ncbi:MAG: hypothetical protein NTW32_22540 [Chloroflexi bacterium]|nr:hypothetical protein [Chloroflexota bacterium]
MNNYDGIDLFSFNKLTGQDNFLSTLNYFLLSLNAFLLGASIHHVFIRSGRLYRKKINYGGLGVDNFIRLKLASIFRGDPSGKGVLLFASVNLFIIAQALLFLSYKDSGVLYRSEYIPANLSIGYAIAMQIANLALIVSLSQLHRYNKGLSLLLFSITVFLNISTGSRKLLIYILLYAILLFVQSKRDLRASINLFLSLTFSIVVLLYTIQLRALDNHGLMPYLQFIPDSIQNFGYQAYFVIYYFFIYGFFVTAQTQNSLAINWSTILIGINPIFGNLAGWYKIADQMRLNIYAPFSLYGEIFAMGWETTLAFFLTIGFFFGSFEYHIRHSYSQGKYLSGHIIYFLCVMFSIYAYEYNLRSSTRYIYYAILLTVFQWAVRKLSRKRT